ncbi:MAG: hypothetical protein WAV41_02150 [Microgenomates group bacterium]
MRRAIFCLILVSSFLFLVSSVVIAQDTTYQKKRDAIKKGNNQERWLKESFDSNAVVALEAFTGPIPDDVLNGTAVGYIPSGMIGYGANMIAQLSVPAASGVQYLADLKDTFLGGHPAYAQTPNGFGFTGLQPILPIWRGFRNVVYLLSSLIFIIIGVMIMLRVKISPQAVINIQNAIPQLVTTLILVTFSYAIAGLLIDVMTFIQGLVIALLFQINGTALGSNLLPGIKNYSFDTLTNTGIGDYANLAIRALPMSVFIAWGTIIGAIIGGFFLPFTAGASIAAGGGIGVVIVLLVVSIAVIVWMFKFYFGCLKAYITIIFKIVVAPLELAMGAFPNSKMGFSTWIWDLIANLAIFPISTIFMVIGNMIIDASKKGLWAPSVIANLSLPGSLTALGTLGLNNIISIGIGLSVVALMSKLPEMIPEFVFAIKPSPWGKAIGEGLTSKAAQNAWGLGKATGQQWVHDKLLDQEGLSPTGDRLATLGRGMEVFGIAKEKRHP